MKILIVTQSIDRKNPILGFFHRWVEEFAANFDKVTVICLEKGEYFLPTNVKVLSLGKEKYVSRLKYIFNFYKYIWAERRNYDVVFVHMNQEYVLLGVPFWIFFKKRITMWRNHKVGSFLTNLSVLVSKNVFCTSPFSYTARFKKTILMPIGIDTDTFKPDTTKEKIHNSILFLGRIAPVKKVDILIDSLIQLADEKIEFQASIYGDALSKHADYYNKLKAKVEALNLGHRIIFKKGVSHSDTPAIFASNNIFVNITENGSFDKTIAEAMACGSVVATSNLALKDVIAPDYLIPEVDIKSVTNCLRHLLSDQKLLDKSMRDFVIHHHSLKLLVSKFKKIISVNV